MALENICNLEKASDVKISIYCWALKHWKSLPRENSDVFLSWTGRKIENLHECCSEEQCSVEILNLLFKTSLMLLLGTCYGNCISGVSCFHSAAGIRYFCLMAYPMIRPVLWLPQNTKCREETGKYILWQAFSLAKSGFGVSFFPITNHFERKLLALWIIRNSASYLTDTLSCGVASSLCLCCNDLFRPPVSGKRPSFVCTQNNAAAHFCRDSYSEKLDVNCRFECDSYVVKSHKLLWCR